MVITRKNLKVTILCNECRVEMVKQLSYLVRRVREGRTRFFCSRGCSSRGHSKRMRGSSNPNYGGIFHGEAISERSPEKMAAAVVKMIATRKENGSLQGEKNGRWAGGKQPVECVICGKKYSVPPYVYRQIEAGNRKPCCNHNCARLYAQSQVKKTRTSIEIKVAEELERRSITYEEQYLLGNKFALDFFLPDYGIVIECDGNYWHTKPDVAKRDRSKNAYVAACGYKMFRFWESEINECVEACVDIVLAEINGREVAS